MRALVAATILSAVALAGCADSEPALDGSESKTISELLVATGLVHSHPAYGFATTAALPEAPEPGRIYDDVADGRIWYNVAHRGLPNGISGLEQLAQTEGLPAAHGIAVFGSLAIAGGRGGPMHIVDVSIPEQAKVIGTSDDSPVRDADTIMYPDGRLIVISTAGGSAITATDITKPSKPKLVGTIDTPRNNHNIAVVPGSPIVYNTGSGPAIDIVDFSDPARPRIVGEFENGDHCHDIAFYINTTQDKVWAICAGYGQSEIWDILDPLAPQMVVEIDYPSIEKGLPIVGGMFDDYGVPQDPLGGARQACKDAGVPIGCGFVSAAHPSSFSHLAILNHDATVLIMGDETGGGGSNQCDFYIEGPDGQAMSGPIGNLWFYDITDPQDPDLRGHVSPGRSDAEGSCTAHFGKIIEDTGFLVMAFYTAGITLVDFRDLDNPKIIDRLDQDGNIWDVWYHQGYLFTGDMGRGMDVIALS